jgi:hypothetical protein
MKEFPNGRRTVGITRLAMQTVVYTSIEAGLLAVAAKHARERPSGDSYD